MEIIKRKNVNDIQKLLINLSKEFEIELIFAVESGSRLWGFHSENSDFDVRFVYRYPKNRYLHISKIKKEIHFISEDKIYDIEGWEIKKFAKLLVKSNPASIEWIHSHIDYIPRKESQLLELADYYFNPKTFAKHHQSLCKNNYRKFIKGKDRIPAKKLLYCLRGYYSSIYVQKHEKFPPLLFQELLELCKTIEDIPEEIMELLDKKINANEKLKIEPYENLNNILESFINTPIKIEPRLPDLDLINNWLIETIK